MVGEAWHWYWHLIVWVQKCVHIMHLSAAAGLDDNSATCIYGFGRSCDRARNIRIIHCISSILNVLHVQNIWNWTKMWMCKWYCIGSLPLMLQDIFSCVTRALLPDVMQAAAKISERMNPNKAVDTGIVLQPGWFSFRASQHLYFSVCLFTTLTLSHAHIYCICIHACIY